MRNNRKPLIAVIVFALIFIAGYFFRNGKTEETQKTGIYQRNEGTVFGTIYHISYEYDEDLHEAIKKEMKKFDFSLSMFNSESVISKVNNNDSNVVLDEWFINVFNKGTEISKATENAFDMTVAPLVNLWGFGFKKKENVTKEKVDSIMDFVGIDKIKLIDKKIVKDDPRVMFDASAIAKGYACDIVGNLLQSYKIKNFMVEIGGEVAALGVNSKGKCWRIGINKPVEADGIDRNEIQDVIELCNKGMATSGNYRNFYYKDGKRVAHTIDPRTGYPVEHSLLSATVIAPDCMTADAYATSFMVLGLEKSLEIINSNPQLDAYFIYTTPNDSNAVVMSDGFKQILQ
ncbi:MAG: FAD:protein FMN transferase [Bacteroidales bacterium]|nr:FAD:protein FMN transferase [Bacteroidales bacterium]